VVQYLKLYPEMAYGLMVPSGLKQCLIRRYKPYLEGEIPLSSQIGAAEKAGWDHENFDALLPRKPNVFLNLKNEKEPTWQELNAFVCRVGVDTNSGLPMAPQYEYTTTGDRVRLISYGRVQSNIPCLLPIL